MLFNRPQIYKYLWIDDELAVNCGLVVIFTTCKIILFVFNLRK